MNPRAVPLFLLIGMAGYGWDWAADPARSAFVLEAALCCTALVMLSQWRDKHGRRCAVLAITCLAGAGMEALAVGCGVAFEALRSAHVGVCDEGTGRPVRAAVGVVVLLVAAYVLRRAGHGGAGR